MKKARARRYLKQITCPECGVTYSVIDSYIPDLIARHGGRCPDCRPLSRFQKSHVFQQSDQRFEAPCGSVIVPARCSRCDQYLDCIHQLTCLDHTAEEQWPGWKKEV